MQSQDETTQSTSPLTSRDVREPVAPNRSSDIVSSVLSGLSGGFICVLFGISYGEIAFSHALSSHVSDGLAAGIVAALVLNLASALGGTLPWAVEHAQPTAAVVVSLMGAAIAQSIGGTSHFLPSVLAMIGLTSICTGAAFFLLGAFRLGAMVRFVPFAVAGGFQAGIGWLMAIGGIKIMTGTTVTLGSLSRLMQGPSLEHMAPGVLLAAILLVTTRRSSHFLTLLGLLVASIVTFYIALVVLGVSRATAEAHYWLLGPLSAGSFYHPLTVSSLHLVDWRVVFSQFGGVATVMVVASTGLLLNITRLEGVAGFDLDVDRDLRFLGLGNIATGILGGLPGFHSTTGSLVAHRLGGTSRLVGVTASVVAAGVLITGAGLVADIPRLLVGGWLLYLGVQLLNQWVIQGWSTMGRLDYAAVLAMLIVIGTEGFLVGTVVGVVLASVLFVISYSRSGAVRHQLSGATYRSNVDRSPDQEQVLSERGAAIRIFGLQGHLFFGTSTTLFEQIKRCIDEEVFPPVRCVVLDCHLVTGIDASLGLVFGKMERLVHERGAVLAVAGMPENMAHLVHPNVLLADGKEPAVRVFPNIDGAVEWCENRLLAEADATDESRPMLAQLTESLRPPALAARLMRYLDRQEFGVGEHVVRQGERSDALYLVESGHLVVMLEPSDGRQRRLRSVAAGALIGELGFYLNMRRTASVVANEPSVLFRLTRQSFEAMQEEDPEAAEALDGFITRLLAGRVVAMQQTVAQLTS